jgi:hypothetical protein
MVLKACPHSLISSCGLGVARVSKVTLYILMEFGLSFREVDGLAQ